MKKRFFILKMVKVASFLWCSNQLFSVSYNELSRLKTSYITIKNEAVAPLEKQITQLEQQFFDLTEQQKQLPLFKELQASWQKAKEGVEAQNYFLATEALSLFEKLSLHNAHITNATLFDETGAFLDKIKGNEKFSEQLSSTLKKQRTGLLEVLEEKKFIEKIETLIAVDKQKMMQLESSYEQIFFVSEHFLATKALQEQYFSLTTTKKMLNLFEKIQALVIKKETLLVKNKQFESIKKQILLFDPSFIAPSKEDIALQKRLLLIAQECFLIRLRDF